MKRISVRFFAAFREAAGAETLTVQTASETAAELYAEMCRTVTGLQHEPNALVAINDRMSRWNDRITDGDEVLLFPPVAGG